MASGRLPNTARYRQVLNWVEAGKSQKWIGEKVGVKNAQALVARARKWAAKQDAEVVETVRHDIIGDQVLKVVDEMITDGLKVQAEVVKAALAETRAQLEAVASVQTKVIAALSDLALKVDSRPGPAQLTEAPAGVVDPGAHSRVAPATLWIWIINDLSREIGTSGLCDELGVDDKTLSMYQRGSLSPSAKVRDRLRELLATVWAREIFDDSDDLADAREALPTLQAGHA